jgi:S1-C subfamily serine protease
MPLVTSASDVGMAGAPGPGEPTDPPRRRRGSLRTWAAVAVLVALAAGLAVWRLSDDAGPAALTRTDVDKAVRNGIARSQQQQRAAPPDAAKAYNQISPSLVTVTTTERPAAGETTSDTALGTGVVINAQGAVLTALHVVAGGTAIRLRFADGTRASAQVASSDPNSDIAVLTPDQLPQVVVPAVMGGAPQIGADVFAVGNPLGLEDSLSAGVVSQTGRRIRSENGRTLKGLIQFDAAVNPGNSGGPLLDRDGQVVGIVTALANPSRQPYFVGIGFAVPIQTAGGVAGGPQQ